MPIQDHLSVKVKKVEDGYQLTVSATPIHAGPEKVHYHLTMAIPQGFNPSILLLRIEPEPTEGSDEHIVSDYVHIFKERIPYNSVSLGSGSVPIETDHIET